LIINLWDSKCNYRCCICFIKTRKYLSWRHTLKLLVYDKKTRGQAPKSKEQHQDQRAAPRSKSSTKVKEQRQSAKCSAKVKEQRQSAKCSAKVHRRLLPAKGDFE
jgi:hypothetical protein